MAIPSSLHNFENELENVTMIDTEPIDDDIMECTISLTENQVDIVCNGPEELHSPGSPDSSQTVLLVGYDTEVVPDSDDELTDTFESKRSSLRRARSNGRLLGELDKAESSFQPSCEKVECLNINTDVCDDGTRVSSHTSCKTVFHENDSCPITVNNADKEDISEVNNPCSADASACDINSTDHNEQLCEEAKPLNSGRINQSMRSDVSIVYTRKRRRICNYEMNVMEHEKISHNRKEELGGLSYVESQEPEDISKALLFVDKYVDSSALLASPVSKCTIKDKSLSAQSASGAHKFIRLANLRKREEERGVFEWNDEEDGNEEIYPWSSCSKLSFGSKKNNQTYVRRSRVLRNKNVKDYGNPSVLWKEKTEEVNDMSQNNAAMVVNGCINAQMSKVIGETKATKDSKVPELQVNEESTVMHLTKATEDSKVPDLLVNEESTVMHLEGSSTREEPEHAYDVGLDTQIAAEAIQALSYATSIECSKAGAEEGIQKHDRSLEGSHNKTIAGHWSYPRKGRSSSRVSVGWREESRRLPCYGNQNSKDQVSKSKAKGANGKSGAGGCMDGRSIDYTLKVDKMCEREVSGSKDVKSDFTKAAKQLPIQKVKCRKKDSRVNPVEGNLKSSNMLNTNEDSKTLSLDAKIDGTKVDSCGQSRERGIMGMVDKSVQKENRGKPLYEKPMNNKNMMVGEEDSVYQVVDDFSNTPLDVKADQIGIHLSDKENLGGGKTLRASVLMQNLFKRPCTSFNDNWDAKIGQPHARPTNWFSRDFPKGRRTCKILHGCSDGSHDIIYSSERVGGKVHNFDHLKGHLNLKGCLNPFLAVSNMKKKRRTSAYISPCWLATQNSSEKSLVRHNVDELRELEILHNNDPGAKKTHTSEHQNVSTVALQFDKANNNGIPSTMDDGKGNADPTFLANKNLILEDSVSPSKLIEKNYNQKIGKKKASPSPLTRELVRLGFRESMPEFTPNDSRSRKTMANIRVLLSKHLDERIHNKQRKILKKLGVSMASCPSNATHFVVDNFARTRNMLEFIAAGKPVVTHLWLESCQQAGCYIDETKYLLRDMKREQELGFRLPFSLDQARKHPLLKGYRVIITPNAKPGKEMLTSLVKIVHGQVLNMLPEHTLKKNMTLNNLIMFSCEEDRAFCLPYVEKGAFAYSSELLLNGIIIQKLEFERHRLFTIE